MKRLGVYIHIPFCVRKCDYCDFLSAPAGIDTQAKYVKALIRQIELSKYKMEDFIVDTVFIGGGTPSILDGKWIADIMNALKANCNMSENAEITIECNPGTVTKEKLDAYKSVGINRISFGLQSANNDELKSIGRIHTYEDFLESYRNARECGFDNINIDLMSALPGQSIETYRETLNKVVALNPEHISAYSLIVEDDTPLQKRVETAEEKGEDILPSEDAEREMYYLTKSVLKDAGYDRYEISNYAKPGYECKHNVGYWKRKDYLGFGIGAASLYNEERYNTISEIKFYIREMQKEYCELDHIEENAQILSKKDQMEEFMFLGLRMIEGVSIEEFERKFEKTFDSVYGDVLSRMKERNLIEEVGGNIRLTDKGVDISNYVMSEFLI